MNTATASEATHSEPTLASVRNEIAERAAVAAENKRLNEKRALLQDLLHVQPGIEKAHEATKERKKLLKELRVRLDNVDNEELSNEELGALLQTAKTALGYHGGIPTMDVVMMMAPAPAVMPPVSRGVLR